MQIKTHQKIDNSLSGEVLSIEEGKSATVRLKTDNRMVADEKGLIHGGFIFSAADYCAMVTVNHPNVVLGSADVRFLKPLKLGQTAIFKSEVLSTEGRKTLLKVEGFFEDTQEKFFEGNFKCYTLDKHVLE
ncbi:MAG: hotdog domain-containing protein [Sulfurihydrogenibium sp.]|jgi:acyl-coenzyme A thioesterase PaaI-like protein|uniref:hotdog domain-containing protein n=1 Tax=Sulfurihydrogenibium sp. TaxID=2053621 RepID=UPI000CB2A08F|nr:MAG: thioesterase [Sulfurihydrogenibium sp.]